MNPTFKFEDHHIIYLEVLVLLMSVVLTSLLTFKHRIVLVPVRGPVTMSEIRYLFMPLQIFYYLI